nr:YwqI/YxiC family protein [Bacillus licheniformis]
MTTIKLKHETVIKKLEAVRAAIDALDLPNPPKVAGKNKLTYTTKCHEREQNIHQMVADYKKAVHKNIKDTKENVDLLKEQDKAIARK